jgi:glycosyltransferase involved in cell wall biosynthesis
MSATWICCQIGQREGYLAPRALRADGMTVHLVTEAWVSPGIAAAVLGKIAPGLRSRYHPDLAGVPVEHATMRYLGFEVLQRFRGRDDWDLTLRRNDWFKDFSARALDRLRHDLEPAQPVTLLSYSYTALSAFRLAKRLGWTCILCQMDCGSEHERIGRDLAAKYPWLPASHVAPPARYWDDWREECALADRIVVNSDWAGQCLAAAGVPESTLRVIPLPELSSPAGTPAKRDYPARFDGARPLRVLYVGQVALTKGIAALLKASALLLQEPVEFGIVGPLRVLVPERFLRAPNIRWIGRVSHDKVREYYRDADVFVFPSVCDGFGIVQSEAVAEGLPVIASRFCGDVVQDGVNGIRLDTVSGSSIASVLREFLMNPKRLEQLSAAAASRHWSFRDYGRALLA